MSLLAFMLLYAAAVLLFIDRRDAIREFFLDVVNGFKAARRQRKLITAMRAEEERLNKLKARIVSVGDTHVFRNGCKVTGVTLFPGWEFEADEPIPERRLGMDGVWRYMGYTPAELAEIHARRDEFTV